MFGRKKSRERVKVDKETLRKATRLFKYIKPYRGYFITGLIVLFGSSILMMVFPVLMGKLISTETTTTGFDFSLQDQFSNELNNINLISILLLTVFIFMAILSFLRIFLFSRVTENTLYDVRKAAFSSIIRYPIDYFNKNKVGEITSRIATDINALQETMNTTLAEFIRQIITVLVGVTILFITSWKLALIMLVTLPVIVSLTVVLGKKIKKISVIAQDTAAESNGRIEEALSSITNVKSFTKEEYEEKKYKNSISILKRINLKRGVYRGSLTGFIVFSIFTVITFIVWIGATMVHNNQLEDEGLKIFILVTIFVGASFGIIPELFTTIVKSIGSTEKLLELINLEQEDLEAKNSEITKGKVSFENVSFNYPQRPDNMVLKNVSFTIDPGNTIALVGSSGSGKSTIASLLLSFYQPSSGQIIFDESIKSTEINSIRNAIGYVPQEIILFGGTIKENIAYGKLNATDEEIYEAARLANALEFIESFTDKWETLVGARGIQLSGGQRQRIAIARALLKDPAILILDEATSALDSESEKLVQEALNNLMKGRTSLVIAHRLSTIKNADNILVIKDGEIIEQGNHEELVSLNTVYAQMRELQTTE